MPAKMFECAQCGFSVKSIDDDELANDVQYHLKNFHKQRLSKMDALNKAKPVS